MLRFFVAAGGLFKCVFCKFLALAPDLSLADAIELTREILTNPLSGRALKTASTVKKASDTLRSHGLLQHLVLRQQHRLLRQQ